MPGTVRKIIERIKEQRSAGNSVVALTVETRLVLQGFDPQRFDYDTPDDAGRLARIREIAQEMDVAVDDLVAEADTEPDPDAAPAPPPDPQEVLGSEGLSRSAQNAAADAGAGLAPGMATTGAAPTRAKPQIPSDHPLTEFKRLADEALAESPPGEDGARSGLGFDQLVKISLLMGLYSIHSDAVFCDQLRYNHLFQWFLDRSEGDTDLDAEALNEDREAVLHTAPSRSFFDRVVPEAARQKLFSSPLLQANGRQIKGWMSQRAS